MRGGERRHLGYRASRKRRRTCRMQEQRWRRDDDTGLQKSSYHGRSDQRAAPPCQAPLVTLSRERAVFNSVEADAVAGRVSWFNPEKRFGFVKLADGSGDAFLHFDALKAGGYYFVPRGTTVQVRVEPDRGKFRVREVLQVDTSTAQHGEPPPLVRKQAPDQSNSAAATRTQA